MTTLADTPTKAQALGIAQNTLKHAVKLTHRDLGSIHRFIARLSSGRSRGTVTTEECERIVNIAKNYT